MIYGWSGQRLPPITFGTFLLWRSQAFCRGIGRSPKLDLFLRDHSSKCINDFTLRVAPASVDTSSCSSGFTSREEYDATNNFLQPRIRDFGNWYRVFAAYSGPKTCWLIKQEENTNEMRKCIPLPEFASLLLAS
jgi:hypothetical protein